MPRYFDEFNRPLSHEEAFKRASSLTDVQVYDEHGTAIPKEAVLEDVGWRFGNAGARAMQAARKASLFGLGGLGCLVEAAAMPLLLFVVGSLFAYRFAIFILMGVGLFFLFRAFREYPPRLPMALAVGGALVAGLFMMVHYLPYPDLFPEPFERMLSEPPQNLYLGTLFSLTGLWYLGLLRVAYTSILESGWLPMVAVLILALTPPAAIQAGWDPYVARPEWGRLVEIYLPHRMVETQFVATPTPEATPTATPVPTPTPFVIQIGNSGNEPVYLRRTPNREDRLKPFLPGAYLTIVKFEIVQSDGWEWLEVRAADGTTGYLPRQYAAPVK